MRIRIDYMLGFQLEIPDTAGVQFFDGGHLVQCAAWGGRPMWIYVGSCSPRTWPTGSPEVARSYSQ